MAQLNQKITALVVDDFPGNLTVISKLLEQNGINVVQASDGQIGLELCNQQKFDVLLIDIHMPFMSGVQMARMVRMGYDLNLKTPIIAVSADKNPELKKECIDSDFDGWHDKPIQVRTLLEEIYTLVEERGHEGVRNKDLAKRSKETHENI